MAAHEDMGLSPALLEEAGFLSPTEGQDPIRQLSPRRDLSRNSRTAKSKFEKEARI